MTFQVVATLTNHESLCIGPITAQEAEVAAAENEDFDGFGTYLVAVDNPNPSAAGRVLAKFASEEAASRLAKFFRLAGKLEAFA